MDDALVRLVSRSHPLDVPTWRSFWDRLHTVGLRRGEAAAVLASLSSQMPDADTLSALLTSLDERRPLPVPMFTGAVNIVGTGGGPKTFNISTASALVAAAAGVQVVKTGSHSYASRHGSFDLLEQLGVPLTDSYEQTDEMLERCGVAFAGYFVYPLEVSLLAKAIVPLDFRKLGRFFNRIGPFLPTLRVSAQVTGVSDQILLPTFRHLTTRQCGKRIWLCTNDAGADELISFTDNLIYPSDSAEPIWVSPEALGVAGGTLADLAPASRDDYLVDHFLGLLRGDAPPAAVRTVCLNAAALAVAAGRTSDWGAALTSATEVIVRGHAARLVDKVQRYAAAGVR